MVEINPLVRTDVSVAKDDPYPTGTPGVTVINNCHSQQEQQTAANWIAQQILNLAAGGMVAGGAKSP